MAKPNYTPPGPGALVVPQYQFQKLLDGYDGFRLEASSIDVNNPSLVYGNPSDVESALENISSFISTELASGTGFISVPDGYDCYRNSNGTINLDTTTPYLDSFLNPLFNLILNNQPLPASYARLKDGGTVLIPAGTYWVQNSINVPPGITLLGEGFGTKIINATNLVSPSTLPASQKNDLVISDATNDTPITITTSINHNLSSGNTVYVYGVGGNTAANGSWEIAIVSPTMFKLKTSVGNGTYTSSTGNVNVAQPIFIVNPDFNRSQTDTPVASTATKFMFAKRTQFVNLTIADNFVEPTVLGEVNYKLPQNKNGNTPLISQQISSNLVLDGVYFMGRTLFSSYPAVSSSTTFAVQLNNATGVQGSQLSISRCFIDGFSVPIQWLSTNGPLDYLTVNNSKIRGFGYLNAISSGLLNNSIIVTTDVAADVSDNIFLGGNIFAGLYIYNHFGTGTPFAYINNENNTYLFDLGGANFSTNIDSSNFATQTIRDTYLSLIDTGNNVGHAIPGTTYTSSNISSPTGLSVLSISPDSLTIGRRVKMPVNTITTDYVMSGYPSPSDYGILANAASLTITLPNAGPNLGRTIIIKDNGFATPSTPLTISTASSENIDGSSTNYVISNLYGSVSLLSTSSGGWSVI